MVHLKTKWAIALLLFVTTMPVGAWFHYIPSLGSNEDFKYQKFGPRIDEIQVKIFSSQSEEYLAFKNKQLDILNEPITPAQRAELEALDPNMNEYMRALMVEYEMFEIDFNNQRFPTSDVWFRKALSHLIDRETYIASQSSWWYGLGEAYPAYSPLSHLDNANHTSWYNPYCTNLYPYSPALAAQILDENGYLDVNQDGWREGPNGENVTLIFYVRGDDLNRVALGNQFTDNLQTILAQQPPTYAGIRVDKRIRLRFQDQIFVPVMQTHEYHMYTGHWWFTSGDYLPTSRDPTSLLSFTTKYSYMQFMPDNFTMNYLLYRDSQFDNEVDLMLKADSINGGVSAPPWPQDSAKYHCWEAQRIMMENAAMIPVCNRAGYKVYLSEWEQVVNMIGQGVNSRWSFLNMHRNNVSHGGVVRYGFKNDVETLNPVVAQTNQVAGYGDCWDWNILNKIYDTLITWNPYDPSMDSPELCKSWSVGKWMYAGKNCTFVTFRLREDVYWQDVPPKSNRKYGILPDGRFNKLLTAEDVKFTIEYIQSNLNAAHQHLLVNFSTVSGRHYGIMNIVDIETPEPFIVKIYFDEYMPWIALHLVGALPILPKDIWEKVPISEITTYDPWTEDTLYGSGPFIMTNRTPNQSITLKAWRKGLSYKNITTATEFRDNRLVQAYAQILPISFNNPLDKGCVNFSIILKNLADFPVILDYRIDFNYTTIQTGTLHLFGTSQNGSYFNFTFTQYIEFNGVIDFPPKPTIEEGTPWQNNLPKPTHFIRISWNVTDPPPLQGYEHKWTNTVYEYIWALIPGDINRDWIVNITDATQVGLYWMQTVPPAPLNVDINNDKIINIADAAQIGINWQKTYA